MKIVDGWLNEAIEIDYLNKSMDRQGSTPKFLILHGTAGGTSAQAIANYFAGSAEASSHFVIGTDGTIVQGIPCSLAAWANGPIDGTPADNLGFRTQSDGVHRDPWWTPDLNPNYVTVSIEHCKPSDDNSDQLTPAQQDASFKLVQCICDTYGIPKRFADADGGITGHFSMSAINRQHCPGLYPWQELFTYLANGGDTPMTIIDFTNSTVASHFTGNADNTMWTCKDNGFIIGHAILDFYRKFGGDALCGLSYLGLPKSGELPVHGFSGVVYQRFERGVLCYDVNRPHVVDTPPGSEQSSVYLLHIDSGIGQDPRIADLQGQIASLQQSALAQENATLKAKQVQAIKDLS